MTKKQIKQLNQCIDLLLVDGRNTKFEVAKRLSDMIKLDILKENT